MAAYVMPVLVIVGAVATSLGALVKLFAGRIWPSRNLNSSRLLNFWHNFDFPSSFHFQLLHRSSAANHCSPDGFQSVLTTSFD
jgi:hypothetical protein